MKYTYHFIQGYMEFIYIFSVAVRYEERILYTTNHNLVYWNLLVKHKIDKMVT